MITWRARAYKPCEAASSAVYLTNQAKSGTRRSPGYHQGPVQRQRDDREERHALPPPQRLDGQPDGRQPVAAGQQQSQWRESVLTRLQRAAHLRDTTRAIRAGRTAAQDGRPVRLRVRAEDQFQPTWRA